MSGVLARILNLSVAYGRAGKALDGIDLELRAKERLAIIGESGSGKSTLALAVAGLLPETARVEGRVEWTPGGEGYEHPLPGRDIGFVFQDPGSSLNPVLTIGEQVGEVAKRHLGLSWADALVSARDLLERVRIPNAKAVLRGYPHQLSGGQRQRVAIASAIAARPKLLIADEPTSALDMIVQAEIVALLNELVREDGMTLLFITHDIALASGFADRIAVFRSARLVEVGATGDVLSKPEHAYTAELIASHVDLSTPPLICETA
jgi:peptide/nickel transport system ATP-binding protein